MSCAPAVTGLQTAAPLPPQQFCRSHQQRRAETAPAARHSARPHSQVCDCRTQQADASACGWRAISEACLAWTGGEGKRGGEEKCGGAEPLCAAYCIVMIAPAATV